MLSPLSRPGAPKAKLLSLETPGLGRFLISELPVELVKSGSSPPSLSALPLHSLSSLSLSQKINKLKKIFF